MAGFCSTCAACRSVKMRRSRAPFSSHSSEQASRRGVPRPRRHDHGGRALHKIARPGAPDSRRSRGGQADQRRRCSRDRGHQSIGTRAAESSSPRTTRPYGSISSRFSQPRVRTSIASYFCPHHPSITGPCDCRKPATGMFEDAIRDFQLDARQRCVRRRSLARCRRVEEARRPRNHDRIAHDHR